MRLKNAAAALAVATLALSACGANDEGHHAAGGNGGGAPLTIAKPDGPIAPENNNPWNSTDPAKTLGYINAIYEPLAIVNLVDPSAPVKPWLASKVTWSPDYKTVTLTARDGVTWTDGKPFTADDIAFTFNLLKDNAAIDTDSLGIVSATASGSTATITFKTAMFVRQDKVLMEHIVPQHIWQGISDPSKDTNMKPVGTGPYVLDHFSSQGVTLKASPHYWGGTPAAPSLNYVSYNDNTALTTALVNGDADWAQAVIPNVQSAFVSKDTAHNHYWAAGTLGIDTLFVNTTKAPFDNVAFRQALNMVIDRPQYAKIAREGSVDPLTSITGLPSPAGDSFLSDDVKDKKYAVDVAGAKKVLTDAGYTYQGSKLMDPKGQPVSFTLTDPEGWSDYVTGISLIAKAAQSIGAEAKTATPDADSWSTDIANGNFQAAEHWTDTGNTPYQIFDDTMDGSFLKKIGESASFNYGRYDNPKATAALSAYANADNDADRATALAQIEQIATTDVPAMAVSMRPWIGDYSSRSYTGWPDASNPYANPDPTQPSVVAILMALKAAS